MGNRYNQKFNCPDKPDFGAGFIYALFDHRNPKVVKYIGKTITPLRRRLAGHNCTKGMINLELKAWIDGLHSEGVFPSACVLEKVSIENLKLREERWIAFYKPLGLLNRSFGEGSRGLKGYVSPLNRAMTAARNRLGLSRESIEKIRLKNLGKKMRPESKIKMMATEGFALAQIKLAAYNESKKKSIECIETGEIIPNLTLAVTNLKRGWPIIKKHIEAGIPLDGKTWKLLKKENI